jgi:hypothetical protein
MFRREVTARLCIGPKVSGEVATSFNYGATCELPPGPSCAACFGSWAPGEPAGLAMHPRQSQDICTIPNAVRDSQGHKGLKLVVIATRDRSSFQHATGLWLT